MGQFRPAAILPSWLGCPGSQRPCGHEPATENFGDAKLLRKFGDVPNDLSAL
jgi:hypothetical protein